MYDSETFTDAKQKVFTEPDISFLDISSIFCKIIKFYWFFQKKVKFFAKLPHKKKYWIWKKKQKLSDRFCKRNLEFEKKQTKKNSMLGSVKVPGLQHIKISANLDE